MTGAELRTIRDSLGLSAEQVAGMAGVRNRTVYRWEVGDWPVPDDVATALRDLDAQIERAAQDAIGRATGRADGVVLVRYRDADDLARYRPDMAHLPPCVHGALIDRVRRELENQGVPVRIVWLDPAAYQAWLGRRADSETWRAQWAATALE